MRAGLKTYDPEKYRGKREKVLGYRSKGISFSLIAALFVGFVVILSGALFLPGVIQEFSSRHYDDAIFKIGFAMTESSETKHSNLIELDGVIKVEPVETGTRLTVTIDRRVTNPRIVKDILDREYQDVVLLNVIDHNRRLRIEKEELELEAF